MPGTTFKRRLLRMLVSGAAASAAILANTQTYAADAVKEVHVGYQKYGTLIILKARGTLEQRLAPLGIAVKWAEFPSGPPLLEALNAGSIDIGTTGESPPIFAQAGGTDLVYAGHEPPSPAAEAVIVPKDSPLKSLADLKGKKVAVAKGSNAHFLLVKTLEKAGLQYTDIQPVYLQPADARAAFESGKIDAWSIWDPFLAAAEKQLSAHVLTNGVGLVYNYQYYLAGRGFAQQHPELVKAVLEEIDKVDQWGRQNPREVAAILAPQIGIDYAAVELAALRYSFGVTPLGDEVVARQQKVADTFYDLHLIPRSVRIADAQWKQK